MPSLANSVGEASGSPSATFVHPFIWTYLVTTISHEWLEQSLMKLTGNIHSLPLMTCGVSRLPAIVLLVAVKSALTHWTENSRSNRVLKIDILSVINVNKNKHISKREVN